MYNKASKNIIRAEALADLTCRLARSCFDKETYFAEIYKLTTAEFRCLKLFQHSDCISIKELAEQLDLTPGRITHILTSLEKKKYIKRQIDDDDRRGINVCLTKEAHPFIKEINDGHIRLHSEILEFAPEDKRDQIIDAMQELIKALQLWRDKN